MLQPVSMDASLVAFNIRSPSRSTVCEPAAYETSNAYLCPAVMKMWFVDTTSSKLVVTVSSRFVVTVHVVRHMPLGIDSLRTVSRPDLRTGIVQKIEPVVAVHRTEVGPFVP